MSAPRRVTAVVVGGGASGLSAAGALEKAGVDTVVLEQDERIGGSWARRYDRLHLHTVREFSGLAHYSIPRKYPTYLSRDQFVAYLNEYARAMKLRVETGCAVRSIRPPDGSPGSWTVVTSRGTWEAPVVVVATGQYGKPMLPNWPGRELFQGELLHTSQYSSAGRFAGRHVLVVGAGNSGTEIATDLAEHGAASVSMSIRSVPPIVPRDAFGMPIHRTSMLLSMLPAVIADRMARVTARLVLGDLTRHGLPAPSWLPYSSRRVPVLDVGFAAALKRGLVRIRPALTRLTQTGAEFADGTQGTFDAIIAATGFHTGLLELLGDLHVLDETGEPRDPSGSATARPGLFFVGYVHSLRGHLFEVNRASRRLARTVREYVGGRSARVAGVSPDSGHATTVAAS